jgi:hypothetical protein
MGISDDLWSNDIERVCNAAAAADSSSAPNWPKIEGALTARAALASERAARASERTAKVTLWLVVAAAGLAVATVVLAVVTVIAAD